MPRVRLGLGFYGPPSTYVVQNARLLTERRLGGGPVRFLLGALVAAKIPKLYARFGLPAVTKATAVALGAGVIGSAVAATPWQLFAAAVVAARAGPQ